MHLGGTQKKASQELEGQWSEWLRSLGLGGTSRAYKLSALMYEMGVIIAERVAIKCSRHKNERVVI